MGIVLQGAIALGAVLVWEMAAVATFLALSARRRRRAADRLRINEAIVSARRIWDETDPRVASQRPAMQTQEVQHKPAQSEAVHSDEDGEPKPVLRVVA